MPNSSVRLCHDNTTASAGGCESRAAFVVAQLGVILYGLGPLTRQCKNRTVNRGSPSNGKGKTRAVLKSLVWVWSAVSHDLDANLSRAFGSLPFEQGTVASWRG
jgi:hypothetical protein